MMDSDEVEAKDEAKVPLAVAAEREVAKQHTLFGQFQRPSELPS